MAPNTSKFLGPSKMSCEECWVTLAEDDNSAIQALTLAKSLRRVVTTRKIAVVICDDVSDDYRKILHANFDQCLKLDLPCEKNGTPLRFYAKVFCWGMPFMRKCVFLDYETMVLKNCDELFDYPGTSAYLSEHGLLETSVLVFEPSFADYLDLCNWLRSGKLHNVYGNHLVEQFGAWIMKRKRFSLLPKKYNLTVNLDNGYSTWNNSDLCIVRFNGSHPMDTLNDANWTNEKMPLLEKALVKYWTETYAEDVSGIVKNPSQLVLGIQKTNPLAFPGITQSILDGNKEPIAIIGMSCRFPQADNLDEYWDILANGKDCIRKVPEHRWPSATTEDYREVQAGFLKCPVDQFDGKFFNISPFELTHTDPQQRFLLEVSWEALEHAGIDPQSLAGSNTGVYVGTWTQDYRDLIKNVNGEFSDFHRTYMGNSLGGTSGRLSFLLGLTGPNIASESGCSSGMVAVYLACESLRKRRSDMALAAGSNLLLHPFKTKHMVNVASPDGRCKTFDEKADGFGRAEGVATLVLKRYSDAVKAGDNILALIRGCGVAQEGTSKSFGTPTKEVQEIAMQAALDDAAILPQEVCYVEAHGTGTVIGDTTEMAAITHLYCNEEREEPLIIASGKTNIGHTESCSGIAGIIKVVLAMQHATMPPHINLHTLNPHINLDNVPVRIPTKAEEWIMSGNKPRIAGISSFGITGTNTHLILQEAPKYTPPTLKLSVEERPSHILTFSAKTESNLDAVLDSYTEYFKNNPDQNLADIAFTLNNGRAHFPHRIAAVASSAAELCQKLPTLASDKMHVPEMQPEICMLFTGQGSQYHGMAKGLYESSPVFRMNFDRCDKLLQERHGISIKPVIWTDKGDGLIHRSLYSQISIFCMEYCLMKLWTSWGVKPDAVIGHSLGEFAAAVCAGILRFEDALDLVAHRSRLIEEKAPQGQMIVCKADKSKVGKLVEEFVKLNPKHWLDFAAFNSPEQTVLAGPPEAVQTFGKACQEIEGGPKIHILDATSAFHSRDMEHMLKEYEEIVSGVQLSSPKITYISGVTGGVLKQEEITPKYWLRHTREPVNFMNATKVAREHGYSLYLEVGPQPILSALTMANDDSGTGLTLLPSIRKSEAEWSTILGSLSKLYQLGFDIDWMKFDQFYNRTKVHLPTYPFNRKKHWYEEKEGHQGLIFNSKSIHSLLGCQIPNATSNSIFQASLELEKLEYLKDHAIGGHIIFPAAGFLEMCLSSGCLSTTGQLDLINPMSVENLTVEAPLSIGVAGSQEEYCNLQTVVSKEECEDNKISIYTQRSPKSGSGSGVKWTRQAVASFIPLQVNYRLHEEIQQLSTIQSRCLDKVETSDFYERLNEVGLEFGKNFKSLQTLWKNPNGREILTEIQLHDAQTQQNEYMAHPVVLDALIQTIMIGMGEKIGGNNGSLYVPLVIGKTVIFSKSKSTQFYAHSAWENDQPPEMRSATLYDENGNIVAIMSAVQMIETTADTIVKNLTSQSLAIPNMYEEMWRPRMGPLKNRADSELINGINLFSPEFASELDHCRQLTAEHVKMVANRRKLVYYYILKAFYELGWKPELNVKIGVSEFVSMLGITPSQEKLISRYLGILQEEGVLKKENHGLWKLIGMPPAQPEVEEGITSFVKFIKEHPQETGDSKVTIGCGERLSLFLTGKQSALSFLFPEDKTTEVCAETFYNESITVNAAHAALKATMEKLMQNYATLPEEQRGVIRFLEVGAGTGSTTKRVLPILDEFKGKFQYTYTDISPAFFVKAQPMLEGYGNKIQYKVLNIEDDPLTQGFIPNHYDIVIASNVLHATRDLSESIRHVRSLLKEDGLLVMVETLQPIREYDVVFGLLDGFWRFIDYDVRPDYPNASGETWGLICRNEGYDRYQYFPCFGGQVGVVVAAAAKNKKASLTVQAKDSCTLGKGENDKGWWLIFSDDKVYPNHLKGEFERLGRKTICIRRSREYKSFHEPNQYGIRPDEKSDFLEIFKIISDRKLQIEGIVYLWGLEYEEDQMKVTTGFLFLAQILLSEFKGLPKFVLVTEGMMPIGDESAVDIGPSTLWGMIRSFRTEHFNMHVRSVDLDPDEEDLQLKYQELFTEFWNDDQEYQIAYRQRSRHVCRLVQIKDFASPLTLPNSERYSLVLPATKNIADLKFCPNGKRVLVGNEVDVEVRATGLNFRDVFVVLKPEKQFDSINCLGLEFAGVVVATGPTCQHLRLGDPVMGCKFADGALPSHIQMEEDLLFKIPHGLTFCEAATIPAAFATAYFCLVLTAHLKEGETVLIHAGSGGVGLLAIQVAKAVGANIIATAGSRRKRAFLKNLGIQHVFHSRNTDYAKQIHDVTKGQGVQVILNSLTSPGFKEASMSICAKNGRFVEMSKLHVWEEAEVKALRPDVSYTIVDLTTVDKPTWQAFWVAIDEYMSKDLLRPIPYTRFEGPCIREALTYMQKAKHIGKIIVGMPQRTLNESTKQEPVAKMFNDKSTYLITGGLGGIGIELTKWMVENGAKHIVLSSRRAPDEHAQKVVNELRSRDCNIVTMSIDLGKYDQCVDMFRSIQDPKFNLPRLRGIFHAAGTLSDATFVNQSVESFQTAFQGKVYGAWNLHTLTKDYQLEYFTMFSSMVSILGPIGLGNYAAANAYIDALCHYRHSLGLCSQSINWGQWSDVGAAKHINMPAVKPFKPSQGLQALEIIMKTQKTQIAVLDVDFAYVRKLTSNVGTYLEELKIIRGNQGVAFTVKIGNFWGDFNSCEIEDKKLATIKSYVGTILRQILKFDEDETIDENQNFSEMGMDSLMMLEMKNFLQTMLGKNITMNVSEMAELTTVHKLASHVLFLINKSGDGNSASSTTANRAHTHFTPELRKIIEEDMILPESIKASGEACPPHKIRSVLLTGATGKLGPYMLEALLAEHPIEKLCCLIRSSDDDSAKEKLLKCCQEKGLAITHSIDCISGDITEPLFGLSSEKYESLASSIDAVVHCAVKGNLMEPYAKDDSDTNANTVRTVNVIGTRNVLDFAGKVKTKRVLHASTLLACHRVTDEDLLYEDWCEPSDVYEMTNVGYPVSKFICEILAKQANARGIPVEVHRFPLLLGDKNGCFSFPNNHAMLRLLGFCKLGAMPEIPVPLQVLDVDFAANLSSRLFFSELAAPGVYNITNPNMSLLQDFPGVAKEFGFEIDIVEYEQFNKRLQENNNELAAVFPYREVDMENDRYTDFALSPNVMQCWSRNPEEFFVSRKLPEIMENYRVEAQTPVEILRRDMQYAKEKGIFNKMKLV